MEKTSRHGYLLLADLAGYTAFLAGVERDHALSIVAELLETIAQELRTGLTLAGVEGDAIFAYGLESDFDIAKRGEWFLEMLEVAYSAFRDRVETIRRRTTCPCQACQTVDSLDLRFLAHHGEFVAHTINGHWDFMGLDVRLVRERVLKAAAGAVRGCVVFTAPCLEHMQLRPAGLQEQALVFEPLGSLTAYTLDLQARYAEWAAARRVCLAPAEAHGAMQFDFSVSAPELWEWLNDLARRSRWMAGRRWRALDRPGGRTATGARNHCDHRGGVVEETIRDWRPFDYYTTEYAMPGRRLAMLVTYQLQPLVEGGTRLHTRLRFLAPLPKSWLALAFRLAARPLLRSDYERLDRLIATAAAPGPA
ncbi:MAG: DUF2652 domain-containing protein [Anaerolineales bacterium]|nr:DUF2652 domain-containing protein [Anaerolineales bacterium]